jgi:hypothetical protein
MKLSQLAAKPQLIKVELNDEEVIKEFGEPLEFHTWDRQPIDIFTKLASVTGSDTGAMISVVKGLILDENGKEILKGDAVLPTNILLKVIAKIVELLGK